MTAQITYPSDIERMCDGDRGKLYSTSDMLTLWGRVAERDVSDVHMTGDIRILAARIKVQMERPHAQVARGPLVTSMTYPEPCTKIVGIIRAGERVM